MYQQFFVILKQKNYSTRTILEKTSPYIKIPTREVTTSYFSTFELLTIFEKSKYRDISKLSRNGFRSTKSWKNFLFFYSHFRISCFIFFWNIKHRSIIGILSALLAEKLQFYSSFKWLSRVFESNPGEMS